MEHQNTNIFLAFHNKHFGLASQLVAEGEGLIASAYYV